MYNEWKPLKMQDRQIWTPFSPSAQSKTDPETITTTKDAQTDFYLFIGVYRRVFCVCVCVCVFIGETKPRGNANVMKEKWGAQVGYESALRSVVKPADAEQRRCEDTASSRPNSRAVILCFAAKVRRIENPLRNTRWSMPSESPGGPEHKPEYKWDLCAQRSAARRSTLLHPWCQLDAHFNHFSTQTARHFQLVIEMWFHGC